jgi:hypothetical protein
VMAFCLTAGVCNRIDRIALQRLCNKSESIAPRFGKGIQCEDRNNYECNNERPAIDAMNPASRFAVSLEKCRIQNESHCVSDRFLSGDHVKRGKTRRALRSNRFRLQSPAVTPTLGPWVAANPFDCYAPSASPRHAAIDDPWPSMNGEAPHQHPLPLP